MKFGKALISGSFSFNLLDNVEFGMFVESLSDYTYNLPSRGYMTGTIVPIMYDACKAAITKIIKDNHYISLTTNVWKSFSKHSYITITCHLIDDDGVLHNFMLDKLEMKERHTSGNILTHIQRILKKKGFRIHS